MRRITARRRARSSVIEERLGQVVVGAGVEAADAVALLAARGEHDDGDVARLLAAAQAAADLDTGELRQHPVEQDEIGFFFRSDEQRLFAVARFQNAVTFAFEIVAQRG